MTSRVIYLTHGDVVVDASVPVPEWGLSARGRARHATFAQDSELNTIRSIFSSTERKAVEAAQPVATRLGLPVLQRTSLGENDRSATGYLPESEFWPVVSAFFSEPDRAVRGWERARDAQARIVQAVRDCIAEASMGDVLIVAHGGVGTLLRCYLSDCEISQTAGQPHPGGGCWYEFTRDMQSAPSAWRAI